MKWAAYYFNYLTAAPNSLGAPKQIDVDASGLYHLAGKKKLLLREVRTAAWWGYTGATPATFELRVTGFIRGNDLPISNVLLPSTASAGSTVTAWNRIVFTDRNPFRSHPEDREFLLPRTFIIDLNFQPLFAVPSSIAGDTVDAFVNIGYDLI